MDGRRGEKEKEREEKKEKDKKRNGKDEKSECDKIIVHSAYWHGPDTTFRGKKHAKLALNAPSAATS